MARPLMRCPCPSNRPVKGLARLPMERKPVPLFHSALLEALMSFARTKRLPARLVEARPCRP